MTRIPLGENKRCEFFTMPSIPMAEMSLSTLFGLLLLLISLTTAIPPQEACPTNCSCNLQTNMIFCVTKEMSKLPSNIPMATLHLYLFENKISQLADSSFAGLPHLRTLDLSYNQIKVMPLALFHPLRDLKNIDLSGNLIASVTNETFRGLATLERLYLQNNKISNLQPGCFDSLENLLEIKLQGNLLKTFYPIRAPNLLLLELSRNPLARLEPHTFKSVNVEILSLSGVALAELRDDVFDNVSNMRDLDLSDNQLTSVPSVLQRMSSLNQLNISKNFELSPVVREDFKPFLRLQVLDVSYCGVHFFPQRFFQLFPVLKEVNAAGNPFHCNCQMNWLVHWLRSTDVAFFNLKETRCHFPPTNAGKQLDSVQYGDLGCPKTTVVTTTSTASTTTASTTTTTTATTTTSTTTSTTSATTTTTSQPTHPPPLLTTTPPERVLLSDHEPQISVEEPHPSKAPESTCENFHCHHGGVCKMEKGNGPFCLCSRAWLGRNCEIPKEIAAPSTENNSEKKPSEFNLISAVFSTAVDIQLKDAQMQDPDLRGFQLTFYEISSTDHRPTTLNLPPNYYIYTLRGLRPNSTYMLCLRPMGRSGSKEQTAQRCAQTQTHPTVQTQNLTQHSHSLENQHMSVLLASVVSSLVLLLVVLIALVCYRKHKSKQHAGDPNYDAVKYNHHGAGGNTAPGAAGTAAEGFRPYTEEGKFVVQKPPPTVYSSQTMLAQHSLQIKDQTFRPLLGHSSLL
ncbi:vasorin isoform X1 [Petromyzon marinus]|uniref:vasorin isoform X1 n=2 Tax=Petromyzon marinus TaxID=7757 RepID=UPI003F6F2171